MLSPNALGGPADYFGRDNYWETLFSIGLIPLSLATLAVFRHPDRKLVRVWLVLLGLAVWFACGRHLFLYTTAYYFVPGMSWFRVPARSLFLANLAGTVLAGLGVQALVTQLAEPRAWRRFATKSAVILILLVIGLYLLGPARRPIGPARTIEAARRVLGDNCFWFSLVGLAGLLALGCSPIGTRSPRLAGALIGLLALCELGWHGHSLLQVAPAEQFVSTDPVSLALRRLETDSADHARVRIKARDTFYSDLAAVCIGIEKTNVNDVFQIDHAAQLYEELYPVAAYRRPERFDPMIEAVEDFNRQVRQLVFDRMSVTHIVSDRFEADPGWPIAARGSSKAGEFVIQSNPGCMPHSYVVPFAKVITRRWAIPSRSVS